MRVAVTGATGRLGSAMITALEDAPFTGPAGPIAWTRSDFDLDHPEGIGGTIDRDRPEVVVHTAAWTDVDACAREPELALRRNGDAIGVLAASCAHRGVDLVVVSTNEVFSGDRSDGRGYGPDDETGPPNPYGASKLAGEQMAVDAYGHAGRNGRLGIVRTAWLFGPPGSDFPRKIMDAAERAITNDAPLRVVDDEWGNPTYAADAAEAIVELLAGDAHHGVHHLVGVPPASRADWARDILGRTGIETRVEGVPASTWSRASTPPRWGVLEPTPMPSGVPMRDWRAAMADYAPALQRERARR